MASGITLPLCFEEIPEMMKDIWLKLDKSRYKNIPGFIRIRDKSLFRKFADIHPLDGLGVTKQLVEV